MSYLAIALAVALFCGSLRILKLVPASLEAVAEARRATSVMRAPDLDDDEKEARVRAAAARLFKLFGTITLRTAVALGVPALAVALLVATGLVRLPEVLDAALSWPVIVLSTLAAVAALAYGR